MRCECATFDRDSGRWQCEVTGNECIYLIPNSKICSEEYGEGEDKIEHENN